MGFIENLRNTLQMQKEQELAKERRANKAWEASRAADERAIKRARECLEASSFPRLVRELNEFIGDGVYTDTREVAGHLGSRDSEEEAVADGDGIWEIMTRSGNDHYFKPYIRMDINWDYEHALFHAYWTPDAKTQTLGSGYKYKHIGIHFEEDWNIHVIGLPSVVTALSKNRWHGKPNEQEKALEKAYLHPAEKTSYSMPGFMK